MHIVHYKPQQDVCLICFKPLLKEISLLNYVLPVPICSCCYHQFEVLNITIHFHHHPLTILYKYNEFFQGLLYQYKGLHDHALKDAFVSAIKCQCFIHFKDYIIVPTPSSEDDNRIRGFSPMEEIAKALSSRIFTGLYKKENYKQSNLSFEERKNVSDKLGIHRKNELTHQKVLIIDDVFTSGSTLKACLDLVLTANPQKVELLVLSTKRTREELLKI